MPDAPWPRGDVPYQFPMGKDDQARWQEAIQAALGKTLTMQHIDDDRYALVGDCPRCGHEMSQFIEFGVLMGLEYRPQGSMTMRTTSVNVVCSCTGKHAAWDDKLRGCGWGKGLEATLTRPDGT